MGRTRADDVRFRRSAATPESWESEESLTRYHHQQIFRFSGFLFLDAPARRRWNQPRPGRPPAGAGPGRVKTWNPENLKTCRAPQPRRFPGFQICRLPLAPPASPRRPRPPAAPRGRRSRPRRRAGPGPWGWPCPTPERCRGDNSGDAASRRREPRGAPQSRPAGRSQPRRRGSLASCNLMPRRRARLPERQAASSPRPRAVTPATYCPDTGRSMFWST